MSPREPSAAKLVIPIGMGGSKARIVRVTTERLEYLDADGVPCSLDLRLCNRNWTQRNELRAEGTWVGERGALDRPAWVELPGERTVRFELVDGDALGREVLGPLRDAGWRTRDGN